MREKLKLKQELYEARLATHEAVQAVKKARLEAGDLTIGERLGVAGKRMGRGLVSAYKAQEKRTRPRKRVARKVVTAKRKTAKVATKIKR